MLTILGIGTGRLSSLTMQGYELLTSAEEVVLQTDRIPLAQELADRGIAFESLDACYEQAEDFDEMQELALAYLEKRQSALLCVLGDIYTNTLVRALLLRREAKLIPGMGFGGEALSLCAPQLGEGQALCCTAYDFANAEYTGSGSLVVTEVDSPYLASEVALKLQRYLSPEAQVFVIGQGKKESCTVNTLCLRKHWDYSCSIVVPEQPLDKREGYTFEDFCRIMDVLLGEHGCPWDKAQTHQSLRIHLLEEAYEVLEAIDEQDPFALADELGDLLMQIVIHAKIAARHGEFDPMDVSSEISRKMMRRHPHIFADAEQTPDWEQLKRREKSLATCAEALRDIPKAMSALMRAQKIQKRLADFEPEQLGGGLQPEQILKEAERLLGQLQGERDAEKRSRLLGELLLLVCRAAQLLGIDGELALAEACDRLIGRVAEQERRLGSAR